MELFSEWLKNIVIISVSFTLLNLILPESMAKYVKVITGFMMMLVVIQPFTQILDADVYFDNLYAKHSSIIQEKEVFNIDSERVSENQDALTVSVYREKLKENIEREIQQKLNLQVDVDLEIKEDLSRDDFGTLTSVHVVIISDDRDSTITVPRINVGDETRGDIDSISEKTAEQINNFFLNFYNLGAENISISKK